VVDEGGPGMTRTNTSEVELVGEETTLNIARAALFAALIGAFAFVPFNVPGTPVSATLQVLAVFLAGIYLGPVWGGAAMVLYLTAGAVGAPVFSGGTAGLGVLLGGEASFGYLWAFPVAASLIGFIVHGIGELKPPASVSVSRLVGAMVAGTVVIYAFGVVGLMLVVDLTLETAVITGAAYFIPAELLKMVAAILIVWADAIRAR